MNEQLTRLGNLLGGIKNILGSDKKDLVLESLGKIYLKTGKNTRLLNNVFELLDKYKDLDLGILNSSVIITDNLEELEYPGEGILVFDSINSALYLSYLGLYLLIINELDIANNKGYVKRSGDTMTGLLRILTKRAPLIVTSKKLVQNLNAEYIGGYSKDEVAIKVLNEFISGEWTFGSNTMFNKDIIVENDSFLKGLVVAYDNLFVKKDLVLYLNMGSPAFVSGYNGYGWRLDATTNMLTVDYLVVRKAMLVFELIINRISATNGALWVTDSCKVKEVSDIILLNIDTLQEDLKNGVVSLSNKAWYCPYSNSRLGVSFTTLIGKKNLLDSQGLSPLDNKWFINFYYIFNISNLDEFKKILNTEGIGIFLNNGSAINCRLKLLSCVSVKPIFEDLDIYNPDHTPRTYTVTLSKEEPNYKPNTIFAENVFINKDSINTIYLYYKYFALEESRFNNSLLESSVLPKYKVVKMDDELMPTFKEGDIIRCQKFEKNSIKYYDALVGYHFSDFYYVILVVDSVFTKHTEISYNENDGSMEYRESYTEHDYDKIVPDEDNPGLTKVESPDFSVAPKDNLVRVGNISDPLRLNSIYITSSEYNSPFINVMMNINRPDYSVIYNEPDWDLHEVQNGNKQYRYYYKQITEDLYILDHVMYFKEKVITKGDLPDLEIVTYKYYKCLEYPDLDCVIKTIKDADGKIVYKAKFKNLDTIIRLGNLNGIQDPRLGNKQPYGYGLYGENVFLTGEFYLNNGLSVIEFTKELITIAMGSIKDIEKTVKEIQEALENNIDVKSHWEIIRKRLSEIIADNIINKDEALEMNKECSYINELEKTLDNLIDKHPNYFKPGNLNRFNLEGVLIPSIDTIILAMLNKEYTSEEIKYCLAGYIEFYGELLLNPQNIKDKPEEYKTNLIEFCDNSYSLIMAILDFMKNQLILEEKQNLINSIFADGKITKTERLFFVLEQSFIRSDYDDLIKNIDISQLKDPTYIEITKDLIKDYHNYRNAYLKYLNIYSKPNGNIKALQLPLFGFMTLETSFSQIFNGFYNRVTNILYVFNKLISKLGVFELSNYSNTPIIELDVISNIEKNKNDISSKIPQTNAEVYDCTAFSNEINQVNNINNLIQSAVNTYESSTFSDEVKREFKLTTNNYLDYLDPLTKIENYNPYFTPDSSYVEALSTAMSLYYNLRLLLIFWINLYLKDTQIYTQNKIQDALDTFDSAGFHVFKTNLDGAYIDTLALWGDRILVYTKKDEINMNEPTALFLNGQINAKFINVDAISVAKELKAGVNKNPDGSIGYNFFVNKDGCLAAGPSPKDISELTKDNIKDFKFSVDETGHLIASSGTIAGYNFDANEGFNIGQKVKLGHFGLDYNYETKYSVWNVDSYKIHLGIPNLNSNPIMKDENEKSRYDDYWRKTIFYVERKSPDLGTDDISSQEKFDSTLLRTLASPVMLIEDVSGLYPNVSIRTDGQIISKGLFSKGVTVSVDNFATSKGITRLRISSDSNTILIKRYSTLNDSEAFIFLPRRLEVTNSLGLKDDDEFLVKMNLIASIDNISWVGIAFSSTDTTEGIRDYDGNLWQANVHSHDNLIHLNRGENVTIALMYIKDSSGNFHYYALVLNKTN